MAALRLTFASGPYDRFRALHDGTVTIEGVDLACETLWPPRLIFDRLAGGDDFDISEFSCSEFIALRDRGRDPFVAIPVFPSRVFRHGFICVRRDGPVREPRDLEGRRVGVPLYTQTAAIWARGLLADEYGVDCARIHWVEGSVMQPGRHGDPAASPMRRPPPIEINESGKSLAGLLLSGGIDAILGTFVDEAVASHPDIVRLFPDFRARESDYFRRTGVFPIMHLLVVRRAVHEAHPWLARRLFDACVAAKAEARSRLASQNGQHVMLPWLLADLAEIESLFGGDAWPYGLASNRATLVTLMRYMRKQGFIEREIPLEDLFLPGFD
ncbi:MAG: hypothetical protein RL477_1197 [Pseudomonadota bacterium]|jgi:4,5-dihydroxyphthalate decarboxylase